jgi:serine/threonine protein kinase
VPEEPIGSVLAGYRLEELIGRGGMSAVYRAEHVHLGKKVALKILSAALAQDEDFRERFLRESRVAASIDHPNVIPIFDAGDAGGRLYIAMRHVDGLDLKRLIERDGPLSLGRTVFFIEQVSSALDIAHSLDLVHRDVKPANVLVVGGTERVFLTDFGVAKHSGSTGLTRTGYFLGTIDYAAPEQIEGRPVDARTDVYAVGCLVYECLTGGPPFERGGEMAVIHAHLTEDPPRPSLKRPDLPSMIDAVIAKAMAKRQAERYNSCGALAQALRAVALDMVPGESGEQWRAPAFETVISRPSKEEEPGPAPLPAPPVPATAADSSSREPPPPVERTSGPAPDSSPRRRRPGKKAIAIAAAVVAAAGVATALAVRGSGGSQGGNGMPASEMTPGGFPDAIEDHLLLEHLPSDIRSRCRRIPPLATSVFLRSVRCVRGGGESGFVTYSRAHSGQALRAYFLQQVRMAKIAYPTPSKCHTKRPAADEWRRDGLKTHVEGPARLADGRVLCYQEGSTASIAWTDTPTKIFAQASRPEAEWSSFYSWWRNAAGPEKDLMRESSMASMNAPYPDAIEKELLLMHVPPAIRKTCRRTDGFDQNVFLRGVRCSAGAGGIVEYTYAHNGTALRIYSSNEITAAGLDFPTSGRCADSTEAADTWIRSDDSGHVERHFTRLAQGRVLCYVGGGRAVIEWTDFPTGIYARASRPASARAALYAWWKAEAGPGALEMSAMGSDSMGGG